MSDEALNRFIRTEAPGLMNDIRGDALVFPKRQCYYVRPPQHGSVASIN